MVFIQLGDFSKCVHSCKVCLGRLFLHVLCSYVVRGSKDQKNHLSQGRAKMLRLLQGGAPPDLSQFLKQKTSERLTQRLHVVDNASGSGRVESTLPEIIMEVDGTICLVCAKKVILLGPCHPLPILSVYQGRFTCSDPVGTPQTAPIHSFHLLPGCETGLCFQWARSSVQAWDPVG